MGGMARRDIGAGGNWRWIAALLALLALFVAPRLHRQDAFITIDEWIPLEISAAMSTAGALDPNWALAPGLEDAFRYPQYNFYFYHIAAHGLIQAAHALGGAPLLWLRGANLAWQLLAAGLLADALRRLGIGRPTLALLVALLATAPGLVQDTHIARTESLLLALTAAAAWALTLPGLPVRRTFAAGIFLGLAGAAKVTALSAGAGVAVAGLWLLRTGGLTARPLLQAGATLAGGVVLGFALGAPQALLHPQVFLDGLAALQAQYANGHPPHSPEHFTLPAQALRIGRYFLELYGAAFPLALAAPLLLRGRERGVAAALLASFLLLAALFVTRPLFFERNFAHAVPPLLAATALAVRALPRRWLRLGAAAACLLPMGYWSAEIALAVPEQAERPAIEAALAPDQRLEFGAFFQPDLPRDCRLIAVPDYNDPWSAGFRDRLRQAGFREVARHAGRFHALSTSTLHTELGGDVYYFACPAG